MVEIEGSGVEKEARIPLATIAMGVQGMGKQAPGTTTRVVGEQALRAAPVDEAMGAMEESLGERLRKAGGVEGTQLVTAAIGMRRLLEKE
ncbi:unnamed protein product, partial [Ilex paraguariensis]